MSAVAETRSPRAAGDTLVDRLLSAVPLASLYLWLCAVYGFEAWKRVTPWLFGDELELTQLSRSIAATGHAARRGEAHSPDSIYTFLIAPFWHLESVATAYAAIKYFDVFMMASVVFPTYFLARLVVQRKWALFAAAGAGTIPALAYSSWIVEETIAYPYAALALFLAAKALLTRRRGWIAAAVIVALLGPAVRGELILLPAILGFAAFFMWWSSADRIALRGRWSIGDWAGVVLLALGVVFVASGLASKHAVEWDAVTRLYKHRAIVMGNWAFGALAIGLGIIPVVAGIAALFRFPGEQPSRALRAFRSVSLAGLLAFGLYTAFKAAWLSTVFATRVEERNVIYAVPLLFVGTAIVLERRSVNVRAAWIAGGYVLYLVGYALYHVTQSPYQMGVQLYSDALGFAILQQANRYIALDTTQARVLLIGVLALGMILLLAPMRLRTRPALAGGLTAALAIGIIAWTFTGEISAASGSVSISRAYAATAGHPLGWVDDVAHGRPTLFMGQAVADQIPEWELEFWNRSVVTVSSLDGTVKGPGPAGGPNLTENGRLIGAGFDSQHDFAVEDWPCVDFAGTLRARHEYSAGGGLRTWRLIELAKPNRLRSMCTGIYPDGWTGAMDSSYFRFDAHKPAWLRVTVSRKEWSEPTGPSPVRLYVGPLRIDEHFQALLAKRTGNLQLTIDTGQRKVCWIRTPAKPFGALTFVDYKFVPHEVNPARYSDPRALGAQVTYRYVTAPPSGTRNRCT